VAAATFPDRRLCQKGAGPDGCLDQHPGPARDAGTVVPAVVGRAGSTARMSANLSTARARSLILGRIRDILGQRTEPPDVAYHRVPRDYRDAGSLSPDACRDLLVDRLHHYQVGVYRSEPADLPGTIAEALRARDRKRLIVPPDLARQGLPPRRD